jgi:hypothetical protein
MLNDIVRITRSAAHDALRTYFQPLVYVYRLFVPKRARVRISFSSAAIALEQNEKPSTGPTVPLERKMSVSFTSALIVSTHAGEQGC